MRQVIPDVMMFAYEVATEGTLLAARMEIKQIPMGFQCKGFKEWGEDQMDFICPFCGSYEVNVLSFMELT